MQSRSARLVSAALRNDNGVGEWSPEPSTNGVQHSVQASSSKHVVVPLSVLDTESDFDSDDSVLDKNYELPKVREKNSDTDGSDSEDFIPCSQPVPAKTILESSAESDEETNHVQLTKKGTIRKRKTYNVSMKDRKRLKAEEKIRNKYFVKPGCREDVCKKKCSARFSEEYRKVVNNNFRKMTWMEQKYFFLCHTSQRKPDRPKDRENNDKNSKHYIRSKTISYFLADENGDKIPVCKTFFLTTLGYNQNNCKAVRNILNNKNNTSYPESLIDGRGHNPNPRKIDNTKIIEHIMSFRPAVSHYRREHAPNKKYLPSDLSIRIMYDHYCENAPETKVSYGFYRKLVKELNISFTKLGHEECEQCEKFTIHNPNSEIRHRGCQACKSYEEHHEKYILARKKYEEDADNQTQKKNKADTVIFAVDLEKVIMLPRMDEFKTVMFCPRLIVFNQSFVPLGDKKIHEVGHTFAVLWHEGTSGRKKEDIVSCFRAFFIENRDLKHVILWLDNCAAQNKNWTLYSYLIYLINSAEVSFESITLRYLEVGHTFMAADEFHHRVERSLKTKKRVYDFEDFCKAVSDTGSRTIVKKMIIQDFFDFEDCSSTFKLKNSNPRAYLNGIAEANFRRGFHLLFYKNSHGTDEYFELDFLRLKDLKQGIPAPRQKLTPRGITSERKSAILTKLGPLMPANRRHFWESLPVNDRSADLTHIYED